MKLSDYAINCTPSQTKRTLELGMSITTIKSIRTKNTILSDDVIEYDEDTFTYVVPPTAEQMVNWLEAQEEIEEITVLKNRAFHSWACLVISTENKIIFSKNIYRSRPEATLAAIDGALEFLMNNKNNHV